MTGVARLRFPQPHNGQQTVMLGAKRFNMLRAGRRWRKTTLCMSIAVRSILDGSMKVPEVIWGSPTYEQCMTAMEEVRRCVGSYGKFNQASMTWTAPRGGRIMFRSLDKPDNARSKTAGGIILDECPFLEARAWYEILRPMLLDTNGWAWLIGTPNGRNWYWHEWMNAQEREDWAFFHAPTLGCEIVGGSLIRKPHPLENPDVPFSELQDIWRSTTERQFRQEIMAEFIEDGGGVFRNVRLNATAVVLDTPIDQHTQVAGLDWALSSDYTVLRIIDATTKTEVFSDRFNGVDYAMQRQRIYTACKRFRVRVLIAEENAMGKPNNDELRRMFNVGDDDGPIDCSVRDFTTTSATKSAIIETLAASFEKNELTILLNEVSIGELEAFEAKRLLSGAVQYTHPSGGHDDTVISLALAWSAIAHKKKIMFAFM